MKIQKVTDEQIAAMATEPTNNQAETLGTAEAPLTARQIERDYGGDKAKAAICQSVDSGTPVTLPWVRFSPEAQSAYSNREFEEVAFQGIQISLGKRLAAGLVKQATDEKDRLVYCTGRDENKAPIYAVASAGTPVNGQPVVDVDIDLLEVAVNDVIEHRATLPVSRQDMLTAFSSQRQLMEGDGQRWPGLVRTNPKANFAPVAELTARAREIFGTVSDGDGRNYREAYTTLREAATMARTIARDDLLRVIKAELRDVKDGRAVARFEAHIEEALEMRNLDKSRRALVDVKKELEAVHGIQNPDFIRQGIGNRPDPRSGGRNDRGRSFQRHNAR